MPEVGSRAAPARKLDGGGGARFGDRAGWWRISAGLAPAGWQPGGWSPSTDMRRPRRDGTLFQTCVPMCTLRLPLVVNALPQTEQLNGLSPVCVLMWICSALALENGF